MILICWMVCLPERYSKGEFLNELPSDLFRHTAQLSFLCFLLHHRQSTVILLLLLTVAAAASSIHLFIHSSTRVCLGCVRLTGGSNNIMKLRSDDGV